MSLKTLRIRVDHLVYAGLALLLVAGGFAAWRVWGKSTREQDELDARLDSLRDNDRHRPTPRFVKPVRRGSPSEHDSRREIGEGVAVPLPPRQGDPGELDADEAVDAFQEVLAELTDAVDNDRKLSQREQWELYNRATGSFTALSVWVDPNDPTERALMEDAYQQMKSLMGELDLDRPPRHLEEHRGYNAHGRWSRPPPR